MMSLTFLRPWTPHLLSLLRIAAAATFMTHGTLKLFGWPAAGPASLSVLLYIAAILEIVGGLLLVIGLFTRPVAFLLAGEMAVAYFIGHAPQGLYPILNKGEPAMLFCFIFLYIAAAGPGPWSIDRPQGKD